jgi:hypothetical protein
MELNVEIKKRILADLPEAYNRFTMAGLREWVDGFGNGERDYASRVMSYLERLNSSPSTRVFGVDSSLIETILEQV